MTFRDRNNFTQRRGGRGEFFVNSICKREQVLAKNLFTAHFFKNLFMKYFLSTLVAITLFISCAQTQGSNSNSKEEAVKIPVGSKQKPSGKEAVATFAEGCFWHTEIVFQSLEGVRDAVSGYAGGNDNNPDYEKVSTSETGHAESVNVYYDPSKISFQTLVKAFFASHDPTQVDGQGPDEGTQYRSIAFYRNDEEKKIIEAEIKRLTDAKKIFFQNCY